MNGHGLGWFTANWRQMWREKAMYGWRYLGQTHTGERPRDPNVTLYWWPLSHSNSPNFAPNDRQYLIPVRHKLYFNTSLVLVSSVGVGISSVENLTEVMEQFMANLIWTVCVIMSQLIPWRFPQWKTWTVTHPFKTAIINYLIHICYKALHNLVKY